MIEVLPRRSHSEKSRELGLAAFPDDDDPGGVRPVLIRHDLGLDHDRSHAGQAAAYCLAQRLTRDGIDADVQMPSVVNTDFADLLTEPKEH